MSFYEFPSTRTYDSDLGWLIRHCRSNTEAIKVLNRWKESTENVINDLEQLLADVADGNFPKEISEAIADFIAKNFYDIVGEMIKTVWFGLTDSGYFVAYIPDSWQDVVFQTTGYDIDIELQPDYGHLVLQANYYTHSL